MAITNKSAANLIETAINAGRVLTIPCPNGDTVTASKDSVIRWGRSRWALPSGLSIPCAFGVGFVVVENCGRGRAAKAATA